jgi:hypothetical protein
MKIFQPRILRSIIINKYCIDIAKIFLRMAGSFCGSVRIMIPIQQVSIILPREIISIMVFTYNILLHKNYKQQKCLIIS